MYEAAVRRRERIETGYEPKETVKAHADRLIDEWAASFAGTHALGIVDSFSRRLERDADGRLREVPARLWPGLGGPLTPFQWIALDAEAMKAAAHRLIDGATYEPGPVMEDRPALIEATEREITAAEAEHTRFVDEAAELGITLPLLPSVKARREREAAARQRVDAEQHERQALEAAIEDDVNQAATEAQRRTRGVPLDETGAPAMRGGAVRSKYIQAGGADRSGA